MKKKMMAILLGALMLVGSIGLLAACKTERYDVEIFVYDFTDAYVTTVRDALATEFGKTDLKVHFNDGKNNQGDQIKQIKNALAAGAKMLIVNPVNDVATQEIRDEVAKNSGASVVFFNKQYASYEYEKNDTLYVGSDLDGGGAMQGTQVAKYLIDNFGQGEEDVTVKAMVLYGDVANPDARYRTFTWIQSANQMLKEFNEGDTTINPNQITLAINFDIGSENPETGADVYPVVTAGGVGSEWSSSGAIKTINGIGKDNFAAPGVDANKYSFVVANNDDMALGAVEALGELAKQVKILGVDALPNAVAAVKDGTMLATVKQQGDLMAKALANIADKAVTKDGDKITVGSLKDALAATDFADAAYADKDLKEGLPTGSQYSAKPGVVRIPYLPL
ncbi:MAG: substrate-binding domain-containing protein [Firmicutes bacterium]|nr:substrate-binding domain-containing protein [Bacillota bacterium]